MIITKAQQSEFYTATECHICKQELGSYRNQRILVDKQVIHKKCKLANEEIKLIKNFSNEEKIEFIKSHWIPDFQR